MTTVQQGVTLALGITALLAAAVGYFRYWLPRWRRAKSRFEGAVDVLFGRPAIVDPATGHVSPKLPSLGERLVGFDQDVETLKRTVAPVAEDVAQVKKQVTENHHSNPTPTIPDHISDVRKDVAELHDDVKISNRLLELHTQWSQEWTERIERQGDDHTERLDDHTERLDDHAQQLADHAERIAALEARQCGPGSAE